MTVALKIPPSSQPSIKSGAFVQQAHLGALLLAELGSFLSLPK